MTFAWAGFKTEYIQRVGCCKREEIKYKSSQEDGSCCNLWGRVEGVEFINLFSSSIIMSSQTWSDLHVNIKKWKWNGATWCAKIKHLMKPHPVHLEINRVQISQRWISGCTNHGVCVSRQITWLTCFIFNGVVVAHNYCMEIKCIHESMRKNTMLLRLDCLHVQLVWIWQFTLEAGQCKSAHMGGW